MKLSPASPNKMSAKASYARADYVVGHSRASIDLGAQKVEAEGGTQVGFHRLGAR